MTPIRGYIIAVLSPLLMAGQTTTSSCVLPRTESGQMITVRGKVGRTAHDMLLEITGCQERVVLEWGSPGGPTAPSATSVNVPEAGVSPDAPQVQLRRDREYKRFQKYTTAIYRSRGKDICMQCYKYDVEATFSGRLDIAKTPVGMQRDNLGFLRDESGKIVGKVGFGHPAPVYRYRLVIESISKVVARKLPDPRPAAAQK